MTQKIITIFPTTKRARERVKRHGSQMRFIHEGIYKGERAILVESLTKTFSCNGVMMKWTGWFNAKEIDLDVVLS